MVTLLVGRGANMNLVTSEFGTVLGQAIHEGSTEIAFFLLERGADVMRVGGSYSTASGVYPSALDALDAALSESSRADQTLLAWLQAAVRERSAPPVNSLLSWPPFPMPCAPVLYRNNRNNRNNHKEDLSPSLIRSFDMLSVCGSITPDHAGAPCQDLHEVPQHSLAALVGLHEDTIQGKLQWIQNDVRYFVACNYDFGLAYAAVRIAWKHFNEHSSRDISIHRGQWHNHAHLLDEARSAAIEIDSDPSGSGQVQQQLIISPYSIMPRRIWDLRSNRVVDFRMLHAAQPTTETRPTFWAVSHSWTDDMSPVWTAINQHQWPVPLPKDTNLEDLRSELLTLGAEYVWVDVLCLRQQSEDVSLEQLRLEEWKLDVPTIGNIYRAATHIIRYFNGLGVQFSRNGWDNERHWLQRAWTLQEIGTENTTITGGIPRDRGKVFLNFRGNLSGKLIKMRSALRPVLQLAAQVDSSHGCEVYELVQEMIRRHATQPLDKLSGLFYLLRTTKLPCYDRKYTSEDIWRQCFHLHPTERKAEILLNFPYRGSDDQWFPTWAQMLEWPVRDPECDHMRFEHPIDSMTDIPGEESFLIRKMWTIPSATLNKTDIPGEFEVKISNSMFGFYSPYLLQEPINIQDDPVFTLAITNLGHAYNWLVCRAIDKCQWGGRGVNPGVGEFKVLKKVGVIRTDFSSELLIGGLLQTMDCLFV